MSGREGLLQGRHADIRRLGRSHRHLPQPQPRIRHRIGLQLHSVCRRARTSTSPETRFSARTEPVLGAGGRRRQSRDTHLAGYGEIDFEGAAQTANSVATNSFNPRMRQASLEIDRNDLGLHFLAGQSWSLIAPSKAGIDPRGVDAPGVIDFESVPGFFAARQPGVRVWKDFGPRVQARRLGREPADRLLRRQ